MNNFINYDDLKNAAEGKWLDILSRLAPDLSLAIDKFPRHVPCPRHGGNDGFRLFNDAAKTGGGICNTCGPFPTGPQLLEWINGWNSKESREAVSSYLGMQNCSLIFRRGQPYKSTKINDEQRAIFNEKRIKQIWTESLDLTDPKSTVCKKYLNKRGIHIDNIVLPSLRYHPGLQYWNDGQVIGVYPALVAKVENSIGEITTLHQTFLNNDGEKAPVPNPKKFLPPTVSGKTMGSAVRLFKPATTLAVAEGIETALGVYIGTGMSVWATLSADKLARVEIPDFIQKLFIFADKDKSRKGLESAQKLAARELSNGREVRIVIPDVELSEDMKSIDWLDILNKGGV